VIDATVEDVVLVLEGELLVLHPINSIEKSRLIVAKLA
jgi:hypothetical protein